jgi:hypothetical protein
MNTTNVIRVKSRASEAAQSAIGSRAASVWRKLTRRLFAESVVGNPLHEAWTADGEPLERMSPDEMAKSRAMHHLVVPHSRSR